jgi:endonuclease/exonuclease/phosphatase family metal-dependent hydrolase
MLRPGLWLLILAASALARGAGAEELSVVSYNVHGLPAWIARDDPDARIPVIGKLLAPYDVALVQEVWGYQERLAQSAVQATQLQGNGPRQGFLGSFPYLCVGCGSGLSVFAALPQQQVLEVAAEPYDLCSDWIVSGNDCWATKGFLFARLRLPSGAELDVYDTHLEAGDGEDDLAVRVAQLEKLRAFVSERSAGRAVILGGDLNLGFDAARPRAVVDRFAAALGLHDAGARPGSLERWKHRIDWILYRDGAGVALAVLSAGEAESFMAAGAPLSDHPAVFAHFGITRTP